HAMVRALRSYGQAVQLPGQSGCVRADVDHLLNLARALGKDLAGLESDQTSERFLLSAQLLGEKADQFTSPGRRHFPPRQKRTSRFLNLLAGCRGVRDRQAADHFSGNGAADLQISLA